MKTTKRVKFKEIEIDDLAKRYTGDFNTKDKTTIFYHWNCQFYRNIEKKKLNIFIAKILIEQI